MYVTLPPGEVSCVGRPSASTTSCVISSRPPPAGVVQPDGRFVKSPTSAVFTSAMLLVTAPVAAS